MWQQYNEHVKKYWELNTTIDRIDPNWNYCKNNCRWATCKEQSNNRRNNRILIYKWKKYTLQELSEKVWIPRFTIGSRLKRWWTLERAVTEPIHKNIGTNKQR